MRSACTISRIIAPKFPATDLEVVRRLPIGSEVPHPAELWPEEPVTRLVGRLGNLREELASEAVRWTYDVILDNHSGMAVEVIHASVALSLDFVYLGSDTVELRQRIDAEGVKRVPHTAVFRLPDFCAGRSLAIVASLSLQSRKAANWMFGGRYEDGTN
jgi:hypothetical protein